MNYEEAKAKIEADGRVKVDERFEDGVDHFLDCALPVFRELVANYAADHVDTDDEMARVATVTMCWGVLAGFAEKAMRECPVPELGDLYELAKAYSMRVEKSEMN